MITTQSTRLIRMCVLNLNRFGIPHTHHFHYSLYAYLWVYTRMLEWRNKVVYSVLSTPNGSMLSVMLSYLLLDTQR